MSKTPLRIGEVAARSDVSVATLRYYERRGLITTPARSASGYRAYAPDTVEEVRLIRRLQRLGFTLEEIRSLVTKRRDPSATCADVCVDARHKVAALDEQIRQLADSRDLLDELIGRCPGSSDTPARDCPILLGIEKVDEDDGP